jgi:hypothetical protein
MDLEAQDPIASAERQRAAPRVSRPRLTPAVQAVIIYAINSVPGRRLMSDDGKSPDDPIVPDTDDDSDDDADDGDEDSMTPELDAGELPVTIGGP